MALMQMLIQNIPDAAMESFVASLDDDSLVVLASSSVKGSMEARHFIQKRIHRDDLTYWLKYDKIKNKYFRLKLRVEAIRARKVLPELVTIEFRSRFSHIIDVKNDEFLKDLDILDVLYFLNNYQSSDPNDVSYISVPSYTDLTPGSPPEEVSTFIKGNRSVITSESYGIEYFVGDKLYRYEDNPDEVLTIMYSTDMDGATRLGLTTDAPTSIAVFDQDPQGETYIQYDPIRSDGLRAIIGSPGELRGKNEHVLYYGRDSYTSKQGYDDNYVLQGEIEEY
jgi:hypothetical protein